MSFNGKNWIWPEHDREKETSFSRLLNVDPLLARLLLRRGIDEPEAARLFLKPGPEQLFSPWLMEGMEAAVKKVMAALMGGEKIYVHGDYDADGICATVIIIEALKELGPEPCFFLPSRFEEGYGLHKSAIDRFADEGAALVLTVDCGINAREEIEYARSLGLDMIITDHHQPLESLPEEVPALNPLLPGCGYPFKELSGAGIAFKLASALFEKDGRNLPLHLLDLAALGTAADVVPLVGENRVIVAMGLEEMRKGRRPGFRALAKAVGLEKDKLSGTALSFVLAPPINAAGRLGEALPAARLLLENDEERALKLAEKLHGDNRRRRAVEQQILQEAEGMVTENRLDERCAVITLARDGWHHGVIGIVASRLVERFNRPVALIALEGDEGRGSARSTPGIDITSALAEAAHLLVRFGGHEQAAGFTVRRDDAEALAENLHQTVAEKVGTKALQPRLRIDAELEADEIRPDLPGFLQALQPYGMANPAPLFASRGWELTGFRPVGKEGNHLKLEVAREGRRFAPIYFSGAEHLPALERGRRLDLAFRLKNGFFRGKETLELEIRDLRYSGTDTVGGVEIIDRRGERNRNRVLKEILAGKSGLTAVYTATGSRAEKLKAAMPGEKKVIYFTATSVQCLSGEEAAGPEWTDNLVFYDLPFSDTLFDSFLKACRPGKPFKVYLLYGPGDGKLNGRMLDLALPDKEALVRVMELAAGIIGPDEAETVDTAETLEKKKALMVAEGTREAVFPGPLPGAYGSKAGIGFWTRAEQIFKETGLLEHGRLDPVSDPAVLLEKLERSPAYREALEIRQKSVTFQEMFLTAKPVELADLIQDRLTSSLEEG